MEREPGTAAAVAQQAAELAAFTRMAEALATAPDLEAFLGRASTEIAAAIGCDVVAFFLVDRGRGAVQLLHLSGGDYEDWHSAASVPLEGTTVGEAGLRGKVSFRQEGEFSPATRDALGRLGVKTVASVPIRFQSQIVAAVSVMFRHPRHPEACRTDLLVALGAHVAAAIQTHRLVDDLRGRVSELTLLNDVAIASAALDPVLLVDSALRRISATFHADVAGAYLVEGQELVQVVSLGVSAETSTRTARLPLVTGLAGQAVRERKPVHLARLGEATPVQAWMREREWVVSAVAVPLLVKDRALGAFVLGRRREEQFSETEMSLLSAIGVQLGIAFDNARLFRDTRRRAADLEAVNALALRMFATVPGDASALLEASTREIAQALSARSALVLQLDATGDRLVGVAGWGTPLSPADLSVPLARSELARRALHSGQPVTGVRLFDQPPRAGEEVARHGEPPPLSLLLVPLSSRRATRGLVAIGDGPERRFTEADVALASALASEAAMGLENAALYAEERRRVEELSLLNEVGRAVAASLDLDRTLAEGARAAARLVGASACRVMLLEGDQLRLVASTQADDPGLRERRIALSAPWAPAIAVRERRPVAVEDATTDPTVRADAVRMYHLKALLAAPLLARDQALGVLLVGQQDRPRRFTVPEIERTMAVANQLAVAIENSRLYEDLRRSYADLADAQDRLVHQARLAALGELAAIVAHEVRNPLGVIFNSLGALRRLCHSQGDAHVLLEMLSEESDRLNRIVGDLLDFAKPATPTLRPESLEAVIDDAVAAAIGDDAPGLAIVRDVPPGLPLVPLDARLMRQAFVNVALNARQAMAERGTLTVRARLEDGEAVVEFADTGPGFADEARHRLFEPFFTTKATGTGLGLAVVKRILDDHRGRVEVRAGATGGTVVGLRVPLAPRPVRGRVEIERRMGRGSTS